MVILNDADVDFAVDTAAFGVFIHQGQICMAGSKSLLKQDFMMNFVKNSLKK